MRSVFETKSVVGTLLLLVLLQLWVRSDEFAKYLAYENNEFYMDSYSGMLIRHISNSSNHLYPYVATIVACGCILVVIIGIILFGGGL